MYVTLNYGYFLIHDKNQLFRNFCVDLKRNIFVFKKYFKTFCEISLMLVPPGTTAFFGFTLQMDVIETKMVNI